MMRNMNLDSVELLLVEDNINDAELTIRELKKHHLAKPVPRKGW
jgi:hypothetical protein